jgi:hypothetical protein
VIDAWQLDSERDYANVPRLGRKNRLGAKQRARLWPVFAALKASLKERALFTWARVCAEVTKHYAAKTRSRSAISLWMRRKTWGYPS